MYGECILAGAWNFHIQPTATRNIVSTLLELSRKSVEIAIYFYKHKLEMLEEATSAKFIMHHVFLQPLFACKTGACLRRELLELDGFTIEPNGRQHEAAIIANVEESGRESLKSPKSRHAGRGRTILLLNTSLNEKHGNFPRLVYALGNGVG